MAILMEVKSLSLEKKGLLIVLAVALVLGDVFDPAGLDGPHPLAIVTLADRNLPGPDLFVDRSHSSLLPQGASPHAPRQV